MESETTGRMTERARPHRVYTVLRNLGVVAVALILLLAVVWQLEIRMGGKLYGNQVWHSLVGVILPLSWLILPPAAVIAGIVFPLRTDKPLGWLRGVCACAGGLFGFGYLVAICFLGCLASFVCHDVEKTFADCGAMRADWLGRRFNVDRMLPEKSHEIAFKGNTGLGCWGRWSEFVCKTTEADFLSFAASNHWLLATNAFVNVYQPDEEGVQLPQDGQGLLFRNRPVPAHYLSFYYHLRHCTCYAFDRDTCILYGYVLEAP